MKVFAILMPILLALVGPLEQALADGHISPNEAAGLVKAVAPAIATAFPAEAFEAQLATDVANAFIAYWLKKHPGPAA